MAAAGSTVCRRPERDTELVDATAACIQPAGTNSTSPGCRSTRIRAACASL
jgi:hypothetical protein|eukprot:COSAG01_NODE_625_length_14726_cov_9.023997_7_plen_51_part_00